MVERRSSCASVGRILERADISSDSGNVRFLRDDVALACDPQPSVGQWDAASSRLQPRAVCRPLLQWTFRLSPVSCAADAPVDRRLGGGVADYSSLHGKDARSTASYPAVW